MNNYDLILRIILRICSWDALQIYSAQTINNEFLTIAHIWIWNL